MISKTIVLAVVLVLCGTGAYAADCNDGGRYEDIGYGTVQDCRTGLVWLKDTNCQDNLGGIDKSLGSLTWYDAIRWVAALGSGHCGLTDGSSAGDWRLPTKTELMAMVAYAKKMGYTAPTLTNAAGTAKWTTDGDAFDNVNYSAFWSSTTPDAANAWFVDLFDGDVFYYPKSFSGYPWPVRGGQSGEFGSVIIQ